MITPAQYVEANDAPSDAEDVRLPGTEGLAQHFVNHVKQQLIDEYGSAERLRRRPRCGRRSTSISRKSARRDLEVAHESRRPIGRAGRDRSAERRGEGDGRRQQLPQSQFNLAVQGVRQPGSSFKPFVLATALRPDLTRRPASSRAADDQPRRQVLGRQQLRRRLSRLDRPRARDDRVRQRRLRQLA